MDDAENHDMQIHCDRCNRYKIMKPNMQTHL